MKLTSIALCKDKHANEYFKHNNKMIPLRHLAPEILLQSSFTTASDVYACGMAVWEVMNSGALPFDAISNDDLFQMTQYKSVEYGVLFGNDKIPSELQKTLVSLSSSSLPPLLNFVLTKDSFILQLECWSSQPSERPTPENLIKSLDALITNENGDIKNNE